MESQKVLSEIFTQLISRNYDISYFPLLFFSEVSMATMKDIAERLGVSMSTVSKGLNGGSDISESLRQAILDTAVELGYTNSRTKKPQNRRIAVFIANMIPHESTDLPSRIILNFSQAANRENWSINVIEADEDFQRQNKYDTYMLQEKYTGAFVLGFSLNDPWIAQFGSTSIPTVLLDNYLAANPHLCGIGTDPDEGIETAVHHLIRLGHEKIAFLDGSSGSMVSDMRMRAYLQSISHAGLPIDPNLAVYGYFVADAAHYHVPGFLERGATAILCGSDDIAFGVIESCRMLGYRVPEDVSVIGFDDVPRAASMTPSLSTIRQSPEELGKCGFYILYAAINGVSVSRCLLRPAFIDRSTTAICVPRATFGRDKWVEDKDSVQKVNPELYHQFVSRRV